MTEQEFQRLQNLLSTVIEQQATFAENQLKAEGRMTRLEAQMTRAEARMTRHEESIAALLAIAEMHEQERVESEKQLASKFAETDERINALVNVVERYISRDQ